MGTIADKLRHLTDTKTAIKNAITAKGVSVADSDTFRSYAAKIEEIQGNDDDLEIPISSNEFDEFNIYFRVDFSSNGDSVNLIMNAYNSGWHFQIKYNGMNDWEDPIPGNSQGMDNIITFNTYNGLKKQALVKITTAATYWSFYLSSSNPNLKVTFINKDYQLSCTKPSQA